MADITIIEMSCLMEGILTFMLLIILMLLMIYIYAKNRRFTIILVIFLFSLVIGMTAFSVEGVPLTPYFQLLFLLFQTVIFILTAIDLYQED